MVLSLVCRKTEDYLDKCGPGTAKRAIMQWPASSPWAKFMSFCSAQQLTPSSERLSPFSPQNSLSPCLKIHWLINTHIFYHWKEKYLLNLIAVILTPSPEYMLIMYGSCPLVASSKVTVTAAFPSSGQRESQGSSQGLQDSKSVTCPSRLWRCCFSGHPGFEWNLKGYSTREGWRKWTLTF